MYVRAKMISGRKYLYLVEGKRKGNRVVQINLCYLGPLWKMYTGVPNRVRRKVERIISRKVNWRSITEAISKIPISLEELDLMKSGLYSESLRFRKKPLFPRKVRSRNPLKVSDLLGQRESGELKALAELSALSFNERFEQIDERTYRMR